MMSEWKEYKLGDLVTFQRGHDLPRTEMIEGIFPVAGSNSIIGFHNKFTTKSPGITIGRSGNIGNPQLHKTDFWAHNTVLYVKEFKKVDPGYFYYLLKTLDFTQLNSGSAVPSLNRNFIHPFVVSIPESIKTQTAIAEILSSLDDKIELNNNINKELENLAQTLFKQYFIDFEFPDENGEPYQSSGGEMVESELGMIPKGWEVVTLNELLTVKYGKDHKHLADGDFPLYGSGGIMRFVEKPLYSKDSILIPRKGTLSNLFYLSEPFWSVDTMFYTEIHNASFGKYLFFVLKSLNLAAMDVGSAVPSMTTKVLNGIKVLKPVDFVMLQFDEIASSILEKMNHNTKENQELSNLRDTLLPKLISGELNVKDL